MPELPEVETMCRGLQSVTGSSICEVRFIARRLRPIRVDPSRAAFRRRVVGRSLTAVGRRGKRLLLSLQDGQLIVVEPRMTGLVLLANPPDEEHLRVGLRLEGGPSAWLWFWDQRGLGTVSVLHPREQEAHLGRGRIGPDALTVSLAELRRQLRVRREVKVALMDQRLLAGIGNLYASEILHVARIHPQQRCEQLLAKEWGRLHEAMGSVLREAIRYEGSTLSDGTYRNALNRSGRYQNHHRVYARAGLMCLHCRNEVVQRIVQAQRSTFFCARCQRLHRRRVAGR